MTERFDGYVPAVLEDNIDGKHNGFVRVPLAFSGKYFQEG